MKEIIYANTGEVKSGGAGIILNSGAIGSCVVITAYDSSKKMGIMAHIMLPGKAPSEKHPLTTRYAEDAINVMLSQMSSTMNFKSFEVCLIGGANVLKREGDTIGEKNLNSVQQLLHENQISINAKSVGGFERRTAVFDIEYGSVYFTIGDSKQKLLWQTDTNLK